MKKLMIGLAVALAATMVQAAQIKWTVQAGPAANRLLDYTGNAVFAGTAYLIHTSDATAFTTQLAKDGTIGSTATYGNYSTFNQFGGFASVQTSADTLTTTADQSFSLLLVQKVGDDVYYKISDAMTATPSTDIVSNPVQKQWTASTQINNKGWSQYTAVPEPTSGLLLLLGVAGLALKRRRA